MLACIDLYGDTVFNRLQIPRFLSELEQIASNAQTVEDRTLLSQIEALARRCAAEVHTYLKFIGDLNSIRWGLQPRLQSRTAAVIKSRAWIRF